MYYIITILVYLIIMYYIITILVYPIIMYYIICFWLVLVVVCTTMFCFVFESLYGD